MWFPCDIHGDRLNKPPIFVKRLPDKNAGSPKIQDKGKVNLDQANIERKRLQYLLTKEDAIPLGYDCHKYKTNKKEK